jgi:hypothetical protein
MKFLKQKSRRAHLLFGFFIYLLWQPSYTMDVQCSFAFAP